MNPTTLSVTLIQNVERNCVLLDLWRSNCCAAMAPGQPPANANEMGKDIQDPVEEFLKLSSAQRGAKAA